MKAWARKARRCLTSASVRVSIGRRGAAVSPRRLSCSPITCTNRFYDGETATRLHTTESTARQWRLDSVNVYAQDPRLLPTKQHAGAMEKKKYLRNVQAQVNTTLRSGDNHRDHMMKVCRPSTHTGTKSCTPRHDDHDGGNVNVAAPRDPSKSSSQPF